MARPMRDISEAVEAALAEVAVAAKWISALASNVSGLIDDVRGGRAVQAKADLKSLLANQWGGIEARLAPLPEPPAPDPNPLNEAQG